MKTIVILKESIKDMLIKDKIDLIIDYQTKEISKVFSQADIFMYFNDVLSTIKLTGPENKFVF